MQDIRGQREPLSFISLDKKSRSTRRQVERLSS